MAGYVACARLQGGVPRFVGGGAAGAWSGGAGGAWSGALSADGGHAAGTPGPDDRAAATDHVELVGRPMDEAIADWLASIGESWSQLTFFLFDPDSWR